MSIINEIEEKDNKIFYSVILDNNDFTVKKFYSDYYLSEIRELLNERISNNFYFIFPNGEKISSKQENFLILQEISKDNKIYLKSDEYSNIKILLNGQLITTININENISLSELRNKLNLTPEFFFKYNKTKIDFKEEDTDFKLNDIILNNTIEINKISNNEKQNLEINNNFILNLINSNIIKNENEIELITNEIYHSLRKKVIDIKILYQGSKDGDNYNIFSNKCFDKINIIILIKDNNGKKFGVFLKESLEEKIGNGKLKSDSYSFYFSLDYKEIHYINEKNKAIKISDFLIDVEGFSIYKNYFSHNENGIFISGKKYRNDFYEKFENCDFEFFQIKELEVIQLILDNFKNNYFSSEETFVSEDEEYSFNKNFNSNNTTIENTQISNMKNKKNKNNNI